MPSRSQIVFEVKPWDTETDLKGLFGKIREVCHLSRNLLFSLRSRSFLLRSVSVVSPLKRRLMLYCAYGWVFCMLWWPLVSSRCRFVIPAAKDLPTLV